MPLNRRLFFSSPARNGKTGYGKVFNSLSKALDKSDIPLTEKPQKDDIQIWYGQPFREKKYAAHYRRRCNTYLTYTMFESTVLPPGWVDFINSREGLLTPSKWCADWFQKCGVNVPIDILHHGVDPDEFPFMERHGRPFTFMWQGVNVKDRKNGEMVRQAFLKLNLKDARLIIKAVPVETPKLHIEMKNIKEIWEWYSAEQMQQLYSEADMSLNPTSGEGFSLCPLEHAATGMAVAVTNFSGCKEYLDDLKPDMIGINWQPKPSYFNSLGGDFGYDAAPDFDHLCSIMEHAVNNRDEMREKGKRLSETIHTRWTWQKPVEQLKMILDKYDA
jgi:glycosyltransferase involved in cell wall biosynthesis